MEWENPMTARRPTIATSVLACLCAVVAGAAADETHPHIKIRGIYGGVPVELLERRKDTEGLRRQRHLHGFGRRSTQNGWRLLKKHGAKVFAEFNTMHVAGYLKDHPDAAPVGVDGKVCPPPQGWQGICPTHPGYRQFRMDAFRQVLERLRDRRHLARLPPQPRQLGAGRARHARHLLLRSLHRPVRAGDRDESARRNRRRSSPNCCSTNTRTDGCSGAATSSPIGSASFDRSLDETRPEGLARHVPLPLDATPISTGLCATSWPST